MDYVHIKGYKSIKDAKIELLSNNQPLDFKIAKIDKKDSLQVFFKPLKVDSLQIKVSKNNYNNSFYFKIKAQKKDTVRFTMQQNGLLKKRT